MKVLLVGQLPVEVGGNYTTGIAKVVYELSLQHPEGIDFAVYATNAKADKIKVLNERIKYYGYRFLVGRMLWNILIHPLRTFKEWQVYKNVHENPVRFEFYKANFQKVLKDFAPDLIHQNGSGIEPLYFANRGRVPILLTCHGVFQRFKNPLSSEKLYADYVTGLTDETKEEITQYFCVDSDKISIIPNGVNTSKFFYSSEDRNKIRTEFGVKPDSKVFITVASVQERKGQLRFTEILKELPCSNWEYWIIGKGPAEQDIKDYVGENGLNGKVKLLGYRNSDELYQYYSAADIYAHASTMEGQALCEIEAFSTGIKILVNNRIKGTIAKEELETGDYLFVDFDHPDYTMISQWVEKENSERLSVKTMDWSIVAEEYAALYKKLTNC